MTGIDRYSLGSVADALIVLGLSEICSLSIETDGATGGLLVTAEGVPLGFDDTEINGLIFETRKLSITTNGATRIPA